ncbi:FecR family protein [Caulobacter sp. UNC358MFTsu5.1]|uniref:FecR family protein n=1 Tax=Caulobacter sp. UNC358MFTsu5.1 TaxID=1449049 RepID=UPI0004A716C1|nr:FecR family protein [Caulobacter sp. UNC358MFTsu5.1]
MIENGTTAPDARDRRAQSEAAAWYAKLAGQRVSNADLAAFYAWRSDTLNDAAYTRVEALATQTRALADDPRLRAIAEAAARRPKEKPSLPARLGRRPWATTAGFGSVLAATALLAGLFVATPWNQKTYSTAVGERRAISLQDGSTIELNTDSQVRVRLTDKRRALVLDRGQAMFAVAHDPSRPFVVTADDTAVRAIGTRFEVYRRQGAVRVTLAEGRVEVSQDRPGTRPLTLNAGQGVEMGRSAAPRPASVDVAAATGWTDGRLTFRDARLADAVAEVNRYSRRQVVLGPGAPANERINGVFDAGDLEAFVTGMAAALDLRSAPRADGGFELTPRPAPTG